MEIRIGDRLIGDNHPAYVIAELGINHNGDRSTACAMITAAAEAFADAVKFQKRTIETVYTPEELSRPRVSVFGDTNGDLKRGLEFGDYDYNLLAQWAENEAIQWFASPWDWHSVEFLEKYNPPCYKIASACMTDTELICAAGGTGKPLLIATGMSTLDQVDRTMDVVSRHGFAVVLMQCTSTYPSEDNHINLRVLETFRQRYGCLVGYSGHERGLATTVAAVALGACVVERHLTLDRASWGSDQAASLEPQGFRHMVRDIRAVEAAMGTGNKTILPEEVPIAAKLRRVLV